MFSTSVDAEMYSSTILASGFLILATKVWIDVYDLMKYNIKMQSYSNISSCILDVMKILREESQHRRHHSMGDNILYKTR